MYHFYLYKIFLPLFSVRQQKEKKNIISKVQIQQAIRKQKKQQKHTFYICRRQTSIYSKAKEHVWTSICSIFNNFRQMNRYWTWYSWINRFQFCFFLAVTLFLFHFFLFCIENSFYDNDGDANENQNDWQSKICFFLHLLYYKKGTGENRLIERKTFKKYVYIVHNKRKLPLPFVRKKRGQNPKHKFGDLNFKAKDFL